MAHREKSNGHDVRFTGVKETGWQGRMKSALENRIQNLQNWDRLSPHVAAKRAHTTLLQDFPTKTNSAHSSQTRNCYCTSPVLRNISTKQKDRECWSKWQKQIDPQGLANKQGGVNKRLRFVIVCNMYLPEKLQNESQSTLECAF